MSRLFSLFDRLPLPALAGATCLCCAVGLAGMLAESNLLASWAVGASALLGLLAFSATAVVDGSRSRVVRRIANVCREVARGNFEARLTHVTETGDLADAQW